MSSQSSTHTIIHTQSYTHKHTQHTPTRGLTQPNQPVVLGLNADGECRSLSSLSAHFTMGMRFLYSLQQAISRSTCSAVRTSVGRELDEIHANIHATLDEMERDMDAVPMVAMGIVLDLCDRVKTRSLDSPTAVLGAIKKSCLALVKDMLAELDDEIEELDGEEEGEEEGEEGEGEGNVDGTDGGGGGASSSSSSLVALTHREDDVAGTRAALERAKAVAEEVQEALMACAQVVKYIGTKSDGEREAIAPPSGGGESPGIPWFVPWLDTLLPLAQSAAVAIDDLVAEASDAEQEEDIDVQVGEIYAAAASLIAHLSTLNLQSLSRFAAQLERMLTRFAS